MLESTERPAFLTHAVLLGVTATTPPTDERIPPTFQTFNPELPAAGVLVESRPDANPETVTDEFPEATTTVELPEMVAYTGLSVG